MIGQNWTDQDILHTVLINENKAKGKLLSQNAAQPVGNIMFKMSCRKMICSFRSYYYPPSGHPLSWYPLSGYPQYRYPSFNPWPPSI